MNPPWVKNRMLVTWVLAAVVALTAFAALRTWSPGDDPDDSICALRRTFGLSCPTCGLTRAFAELAKGRFGAASRLHPMSTVLLAELGLAWALAGIAAVRPGAVPPRRAVIAVALMTVAALAGVWIYRLAAGTLPP